MLVWCLLITTVKAQSLPDSAFVQLLLLGSRKAAIFLADISQRL